MPRIGDVAKLVLLCIVVVFLAINGITKLAQQAPSNRKSVKATLKIQRDLSSCEKLNEGCRRRSDVAQRLSCFDIKERCVNVTLASYDEAEKFCATYHAVYSHCVASQNDCSIARSNVYACTLAVVQYKVEKWSSSDIVN